MQLFGRSLPTRLRVYDGPEGREGGVKDYFVHVYKYAEEVCHLAGGFQHTKLIDIVTPDWVYFVCVI